MLKILHFNDVYDIEERKPHSDTRVVAGAARFITAMEQHGCQEKLVLFSGDLFGASSLSTHFKGEQMLEVFKRCNVSVSCLGNHDTDFGFAKMGDLIAKTQVPWLMSNLYH
jgi:2',3'-cyclic-nucleotide 2'-phosphodiesterase (5'-nucleotidase family)